MEHGALPPGLIEGVFVGRDQELAAGAAVLEDVLAGRARLLLVAGEPGIGKSRIADELSHTAKQSGMLVAWGRCWEAGGAPAYWPWVQSLRALVRDLDASELRRCLTDGALDVAQLIPEIATAVGNANRPVIQEPDAARFNLFDSVATFLKNVAVSRPVMLVLDDLQVADTPSLLLLRFVARALGDDRILLVGTYRDTEITDEHPLSQTLTQVTREPIIRRLSLRGLTEEEVASFIAATAGFAPLTHLARTVHRETEGNPLFVQEVVRVLVEEGRLKKGAVEPVPTLHIPRTVREVIGRRLKPLAPDSLAVLSVASVFGREFNLRALSRLTERPWDEVMELLEEPLATGVVTDVPGAKNVLRFSHVLIRETLHDHIGRAGRLRLHYRAGTVLEELYREDVEPHLAELAHHFFEGMAGDNVEKAVDYARRAGDNAVSLLAYEEAVRLYQMALDAGARRVVTDRAQRCQVLLALGDAQARAGDEAGSTQTFFEAAELSKALKHPEYLARAALGYGGRLVWVRAGGDRRLIPLLQDAIDALGHSDNTLRARLMARMAGALRSEPSAELRESLATQAVELARGLDDPATLAYTLDGLSAALWKPDIPHERLAIANELIEVGTIAGDRERVISGRQFRVWVFLEIGDMASAYRELEETERIAVELRQPAQGWLPASIRVSLALLEGQYGSAEDLMSLSHYQRARTNRSDAVMAYALHAFQVAREQARLDDVQTLLAESAREFVWYPHLRCALTVLHCELGHVRAARTAFDELAADDFAVLPFDNKWLFAMSLLSEAACLLGDSHRAQVLYESLLPYWDRNAGAAGDGSMGSVSRPLGLLATTLGRLGDATRHFEQALEQNERLGARPFVAHTQHELGVLLANRGSYGDSDRAGELLSAALATSIELGMSALHRKVTAALEQSSAVTAGGEPALSDRASTDAGTFRLEGEYWTIVYGDGVVRLKDSKGMRVLARLLAEPGRPHASLDLERLGTPGDDALAHAAASGDAGELIDEEARRAYRSRLAELRRAIDEVDAVAGAEQVGAMQEEMDFITRELSRALGLGGRSRHAGSTAERARLNVTRAVKSALRRIEAADATLAAHLEATVRTGTVCVYMPDPRAPLEWRVSLEGVHSG